MKKINRGEHGGTRSYISLRSQRPLHGKIEVDWNCERWILGGDGVKKINRGEHGGARSYTFLRSQVLCGYKIESMKKLK